jgi:hypothetical protein
MALAAHNRAFLILEVTALAVQMKRLSQARLVIGTIFIMALGAALILRRFILHFIAVFINMVAFIALFYLSQFIVLIMSKNNRGTLLFGKAIGIDHLHIFLGKCRKKNKTHKHRRDQNEYDPLFHLGVSLFSMYIQSRLDTSRMVSQSPHTECR